MSILLNFLRFPRATGIADPVARLISLKFESTSAHSTISPQVLRLRFSLVASRNLRWQDPARDPCHSLSRQILAPNRMATTIGDLIRSELVLFLKLSLHLALLFFFSLVDFRAALLISLPNLVFSYLLHFVGLCVHVSFKLLV